jgi:hypothetical protein
MTLIQAKQVKKLLDAPLSIAAFTTTAAVSDDVTIAVQAVLTATGVTEAVATATVAGVLTSGNNRVEIWNATTKEKINDAQGNEVYGRVTGAIGAWALEYYSLVAGVETAFTMPVVGIDFDFNYKFEFKDLPAESLTKTKQMVYDDLSSAKGQLFAEKLTIAVQNTVPNVTKQPSATESFELIINGKVETTVGLTPAVTASTANKTVSFSAANAGYNLDTTDHVVAVYLTKEA